ncbi:MAG: cupin domain-containing protein [Candidatus Omnitrophota bacterium]
MADKKVKAVVFEGSAGYLRLLSGVPETKGMKAGYVVLQPGDSVGAHSTGAREEAIIILEGTLQVLAGGRPAMNAGKGELVYIPPQTDHDMKNTGAGAARYVYVVSPILQEAKC